MFAWMISRHGANVNPATTCRAPQGCISHPRAAATAAQLATSQIEGSYALSALYCMASHSKGGHHRCRVSHQQDDDLGMHQHTVCETVGK